MKFKKILLPILAVFSLGVFYPSFSALAAEETWGPERATFSWEKPASYRTFNSITDNPSLGDERNFVRVREAGSGDKYSDNVTVVPGKEYEVYIYYHNNAAASLNDSGKGIADGVRMSTSLPEKIEAGHAGVVKGVITATNTNPTSVWDTAYLNADTTVYMRYVPNSAVLHNAGTANGTILAADALFSEDGARLAHWNDWWGAIPGCNEYAGYVTYRLKADKPGFFITKTASTAGANAYGESLNTTPGAEIDFKISYKNTGTTIQNGVTVYDVMPEGMEYIPGTVFVVNKTYPEGKFVSDSLFDGGLNIGGYNAGEEATITYKAKLTEDTAIFPCGTKDIYNNSSVATGDGTEYDKVRITVTRTCNSTPTEIPETGPAEIVLALIVAAAIGTGTVYLIRSRMTLSKVEDKVKK